MTDNIYNFFKNTMTFSGDHKWISIIFYLYFAMFIISIIGKMREKRKAESSISKLPMETRLKVAIEKDEHEWKKEKQKKYVESLSKPKVSAKEEVITPDTSSNEEIAIDYASDTVESLRFDENYKANLFPYKIMIGNTEYVNNGDLELPFKKGTAIAIDTGVMIRTDYKVQAELSLKNDNKALEITSKNHVLKNDFEKRSIIIRMMAKEDGILYCDDPVAEVQLRV